MDETQARTSIEKLGKYKILGKLGSGGMADVYLAEDTDLDRKVALKILPSIFTQDGDFLARFAKEVKASAALNHDNIVRIYDVGHDQGVHFYAMELLDGGDLKQKITKGVSVDEALSIAQAIASALGHAHDKGFVHRDIKPQNILFTSTGKPVLTDLGIVKALNGGTQLTETGASIGTPHYMSPEQGRGKELDGRSDLYALGIVLFEMLTGNVPFSNGDTFAVIFSHIHDPVPNLPNHLKKYQPLLNKLLAKEAKDRYGDAEEVAQAVATAKRTSTVKRRVAKELQTGEIEKLSRRKLALAIVVILILAPNIWLAFTAEIISSSSDRNNWLLTVYMLLGYSILIRALRLATINMGYIEPRFSLIYRIHAAIVGLVSVISFVVLLRIVSTEVGGSTLNSFLSFALIGPIVPLTVWSLLPFRKLVNQK